MLLADPNDDQLRQQISAVYERYSHFMDADLQQRAVEYMGLMKHPDVASRNVTAMPKWEKRKSLLLRRMAEKDVRALSSTMSILVHVTIAFVAIECRPVNITLLETTHSVGMWVRVCLTSSRA